MADLENQLDASVAEHAAQLAQLEQVQSAEAESQVAAAMAAVTELETALAAANRARDAEAQRVTELEATLRDASDTSQQVDALQQDLLAARTARDEALGQVDQLQADLAEVNATEIASAESLDQELRLAQAQIGELEREISQWRELAATADLEAKSAQSELERMTAAQAAEMDNFQTVTAVQLQKLQENETAMAELREALAQREQRIAVLVAAETSSADRVLELESLVANSEDRLRDLDGIRRQLADARSEIVETERNAQAQIGELASQVAVLEGQVNRDEIALKTATDRVAQLETDLASARREVTALTDNDALAALTAARDAAVLEARDSGDRLANARSEIAVRDARIFELERTIRRSRSSEDQYVDLVSELEAAQQAIQRLETELA